MEEDQYNRIKSLLVKQLLSDLTDEEREELEQWRNLSDENEALYQRLSDKDYLLERFNDFNEVLSKENIGSINLNRRAGLKVKFNSAFRNVWFRRIASSFIIIASAYSAYRIVVEIQKNYSIREAYSKLEEVRRRSVTLTIGGNKVIDISNLPANTRIEGVDAALIDGSLNYSLTDNVKRLNSSKVEMHEIFVPEIKIFKVVLPDGSKVWLNSRSHLYYPSVFGDSSREVSLDGEGYFEISKDAERPFVVRGNGLNIRVTGTKFNFKAYGDDNLLSATLAEGKITVGYKDASGQYRKHAMQPGYQSNLDKESKELSVQQVNTSFYTCWKDGLYYFDSMRLEDIMDDIGRWYGLEIVFVDNTYKDRILSGKLSREDDAEKMLESFRRLMPGHIVLRGRTVTIY
ncbi:MAG: FecR domain-containing protein [Rikenellaceae bacterium]|jgi:ferric-dicitrate binding protein FerR (iron transport regulator)